MSKNRVDFIDVAKGIAILLVIIGHCLPLYPTEPVHYLNSWIFTFHMPLFFILSGYFYKPGNLKYGRLAKALLLPYIVFSTLNIALKAILYRNTDIGMGIAAMFYGNASSMRRNLCLFDNIKVINMLWFFIALFFCRIIYSKIDSWAEKNQISMLCTVTLTALIGIELSDRVWLPFSLQPAMTGVFFYHVGRMFKERNVFEKSRSELSWSIIIFGCIIWICAAVYGRVRMNANYFSGIIDFAGAIIGTYMIVQFSKILLKIRGLKSFILWCGKNSVVIYCIHSLDNHLLPAIKGITSEFFELESYGGLIMYTLIRLSIILSVSFLYVFISGRIKTLLKARTSQQTA